MNKKIIAAVLLMTLIVTQLFVPTVFADRDDLAHVVEQLDGLEPDEKGKVLAALWDCVVARLSEGEIDPEEVLPEEVLNDIISSLAKVNMDHLIVDGVEPGDGKISKTAVLIVINQLLDSKFKEFVTGIYNTYSGVISKPAVKIILGLPSDASAGDVFVKLTEISVPILKKDKDGNFEKNDNVRAGFARRLSQNISNDDDLKGLFEAVLDEMNEQIDELAEKINDKVKNNYGGITESDVIKFLELYDLYEEDPTPPSYVSSNPSKGATGISIRPVITVTYDKEIYEGDNFENISLRTETGQNTVSIRSEIDTKVLTITLDSDLNYDTTYTLRIPEGAIVDEVMRAAKAETITFTTRSQSTPVTPPSTPPSEETPTTPPEKPQEPEDEEQKQIITEVETIIGSIIEEDIVKAEDDELENITQDISQKLKDAAQLIASVKDPEFAANLAKDLIQKTGTLASKLIETDNTVAYDAIVKDTKQIANTVIANVSKLELDEDAVTVTDGKVTVQVKLGEAEEGKLIDKATEEKLDLIISMTQALNQAAQDAGIDEDVVEPVLVIDVTTGEENVSASVEVPSNLVLALNEKGIKSVVVSTDVATFSVPSDAIDVGADTVIKFNADKVDITALPDEARTLVGDSPVFDLYITINDVRVSNYKKLIGVRLPYTLKPGEDPERITVFFIDENGQLVNVIGKYDEETKTVYFEAEHFSHYIVKENVVKFEDVKSNFWAANYIEVMASKGIIKGVGAGKFAPGNNVTRAEFIAMIIREFKLFDDTAVNNFKDVSEKDWFYPEVTSAAKLGIVQGRPGGIFAPNDKITREEMAIMLSNVLTKVLNKKAPANTEALLARFKDKDLIADYAKDAVAMGVRYGILVGRTDGTFAPKDNANRAEAAKLIYMMFYME